MYIAQQQEQFSNAYLGIVAAVAGCKLATSVVDDDSVDFTIQGTGFTGMYSRPQLDVQLKCKMKDASIGPRGFSYPLKIKNYNDLIITDILIPRILVVVVVPNNTTGWLGQSDNETLLKYCSYWVSIRGKSRVAASQKTVSVHLPQANRLTVSGLSNLLQIVASGGTP
jgi:hypothetical protein